MTTTNYYQKNKEKIKKQSRERYYKRKEKLCQKVTCECGSILSFQNMKHHLSTGLHDRRLRKIILKKFCIKHLLVIDLSSR